MPMIAGPVPLELAMQRAVEDSCLQRDFAPKRFGASPT
jgi:hypothetical protein